MRCDGRTFTETNGNIVSGKADRAVNRGPNTEQINISRNSFVFSDRLGARRQMHQTLSGHFSPQMSQKTSWRQRAPSAGHRPWTLTSELDPLLRGCCFGSCGQTSPGLSFQPRYRPSWDLFRDVFGWAEYSNEAIFATQPNQLKTQRGQSAFYEFSLDGRPPKGFSPQPCSCAVNGLWLCKVNSSNPWQWCTAVIAKRLFLTRTQSTIGHHTGLVQVTCGPWGI